jgi:ketosteroid isomerase-like protein
VSANLDLVRSIYAAFERGDYTSADWADPEIVRVVVDGPEPGSSTGLDGLAEAMRDVFSAIEDARAEADEYRELDDERVLVLMRAVGRGKRSGAPVSMSCAEVFEAREGKVIRVVFYFDRANALADLGLEE